MNTTVTVGSGRSIHWGSEFGTRCGAAHRSGRFTSPKPTGDAVTCKRCVKIVAAQVETDHAEAVKLDEKRQVVRAALSVDSSDVLTWGMVEQAFEAYTTGRDAANAADEAVAAGQTWTSTDAVTETVRVTEVAPTVSGQYVRYVIVTGDRTGNAYGLFLGSFLRWFGRSTSIQLQEALELAHDEALEHAEIHAFEQKLYNELRSEGWSHQDSLEMTEGARAPEVPWSEPTAATARYDELVSRHAGTVPFLVRNDWSWWNGDRNADGYDARMRATQEGELRRV
jgi:hypothetical protein